MGKIKGFDSLHAIYMQQTIKEYIDGDIEYKRSFLNNHDIIVNCWLYGKYIKETNSVKINIKNPFTGKSPVFVKLVTNYNIPTHYYRNLRVFIKINNYFSEQDSPDDVFICDLDPEIKEKINDINKRAKEALEEENRKKEQEEIQKRVQEKAKEKEALVRESENHFEQITKALDNAESFLLKEKEEGKLIEFPDYLFNYNDKDQQAAYNMRYLYAYSYEYLTIFIKLIDMGVPLDKIRILSLGCGTTADLWAIEEALRRKRRFPELEYIGIDKALWEKRFCLEAPQCDSINVIYGEKAGEYIAKNDDLEFDIFIFPKSLGDIIKNDRDDFRKIVLSFKKMNFKDTFYIVFSFVKNETDDILIKARRLIDIIKERGYSETHVVVEAEDNQGEIGYSRETPFEHLPEKYVESSKELAGKHYIKYRRYEHYRIYKLEKE